MSPSTDQSYARVRRLGLGLLLLALPACGLSEYEGLMRDKAQKNEEHFRNEQAYLDEPVQIPTQKNKEGKDMPLANVFFRPPKGISSKPESEPWKNLLWQYSARSSGGDFVRVDMAFATDDKEFVRNVLDSYTSEENLPPPQRDPPLPFDSWEFHDVQNGYSINVLKGGGRTQVAVVYVFGKGRRDALRTVIDLSLQSLAVDGQAVTARQKYSQKSPWQLKPTPTP